MSMFKALRVGALLLILVIVAGTQWLGQARLASWEKPLWITIYPLVADGRAETREYVASLDIRSFSEISDWLRREAARYQRDLPNAAYFQLAPVPDSEPPDIPRSNNIFTVGWWSLRMRWWAWRQDRKDGLISADIQVFMRYQTSDPTFRLDRSIGVRKGRYTVVNAYAARGKAARNRLVLAHELLHVLGATDKYDPATGRPLAPHGLADPQARPLYPQTRSEIMAGAIALDLDRARMPATLAQTVVGPATAREIGWTP